MRQIFGKIYRFFIELSKILSRKGLYPFLDKEFSQIEKEQIVLSIGVGGR